MYNGIGIGEKSAYQSGSIEKEDITGFLWYFLAMPA